MEPLDATKTWKSEGQQAKNGKRVDLLEVIETRDPRYRRDSRVDDVRIGWDERLLRAFDTESERGWLRVLTRKEKVFAEGQTPARG